MRIALVSQDMSHPQTSRLTWNKTILLVTGVFLLSAAATFPMLANSLYLVPPLTNGTPFFYLVLVSVPPIVTLILCARRRPAGLRFSGMLVMFWIAVLVMVYLALSGPALYRYTAVECHGGVRSGWVIHHACTCRQISSEARAQADCSLDGFALSPLLSLTRQGNWQLIW